MQRSAYDSFAGDFVLCCYCCKHWTVNEPIEWLQVIYLSLDIISQDWMRMYGTITITVVYYNMSI